MASLDDIIREAADRFREGLVPLAEEMAERHREEIDDLRILDSPELWEIHKRLMRESRSAQAGYLMNGRSIPQACPTPDLEAAEMSVLGALPLPTILKGYRIGHTLTMEAWLAVVDSLEHPEEQVDACRRAITSFVLSYDERIAHLVSDHYHDAERRARADPQVRRLGIVRDVLNGTGTPAELGYELERDHLGLVAWGDDAAAERAVKAASEALGCEFLCVRSMPGLHMAWLGCDEVDPAHGPGDLERLDPGPNARLAVGTRQAGPEGFRRTHRQAGDAHVVGRRNGSPVVFYADVSLEAMLLRDTRRAQEFVAQELAGLDGSDKRCRHLRETLRAYFRSGQNAASTAASLGVRDSTVSSRLRRAEEIIGTPVSARSAELDLALRVHELLDG